MVGVAQLVEPQIVDLAVVGSSPIAHPNNFIDFTGRQIGWRRIRTVK